MWNPPIKLIVARNRSAGNPEPFVKLGLQRNWPSSRLILPAGPCCERARPVVGLHQWLPVRYAGVGVGLSRSMRRRMSANKSRGTATYAIWNVT